MIIKMATHKDITQLCELRWDFVNTNRTYPKTLKEQFVKDFNEFLEVLLNKSYVVFCAYQGENLVGAAYMNVFFNPIFPEKKPTKTVILTDLFVKSGYRKQGVGRNLINNIKSWASSNSVDSIICQPTKDEIKFVKINGFEQENGLFQLNK